MADQFPSRKPSWRQIEAQEFAQRIKAMGFHVYVAEQGHYGYITDDSEKRVLCWQVEMGTQLSGCYGPPSTTSGTEWGMDIGLDALDTAEKVRDALYAVAPIWAGKGFKYYTTAAQHRAMYQSSSRYSRF